ncbi:urease accessory protein [Herbihabitans rhizosphaerae]|uniref:Urease accessory protein n=1 Tax=Herbihabitans rhizosphaerae TaxID=1872711 RepID=A0A4Q7L1Z6_9PSEU|nr:urease accessory UreF family protein [Herbihabitans rhizosphaerae]RZS43549.1 urease accessory protein [Herbihabitans rhizosphaerae]
MHAAALMLADSRFPGGGHAHSGGLEEAVARGLVHSESDLAPFLAGRLRTAGELAAVFAGAAAHAGRRDAGVDHWRLLDAELDARTPSPAQRTASRAQGRGTLRAVSHLVLDTLAAATPRPHHPIAVGAVVGASEGAPADAALTVAYLAVSGPASAAVRLLGLDPFAVNALVMRLIPVMHTVAEYAVRHAGTDPADLPAPAAVGLDLLAEAHDRHSQKEVRLFAS